MQWGGGRWWWRGEGKDGRGEGRGRMVVERGGGGGRGEGIGRMVVERGGGGGSGREGRERVMVGRGRG